MAEKKNVMKPGARNALKNGTRAVLTANTSLTKFRGKGKSLWRPEKTKKRMFLDFNSCDNCSVHEMEYDSKFESLINELAMTEKARLDKLLDSMYNAIHGLGEIKKESKHYIDKTKEYEMSNNSIEEMKMEGFDLDSLKLRFDAKFPKLREQLLKEVTNKVERLLVN
ncbi:uncharacterized protein LOC113508959 [Trichoplusia ni]|uniref:Uncharacterized protein LOC113508959 n=1 Tax=Trichoplusia ni TaxID=7111 RepID=A0A7E5X5F5_TRINI|nr:uncharacterized protein LOC113508959 [Trichoplusia ni]